MEEVCEELDKLTLQFFENLESLQDKRQALSDAVRDGHLNLSMARYSMGNKAVSSLQYSHKMECALYHVDLVDEENLAAFRLRKVNPGEVLSEANTSDGNKLEGSTALRRRKPRNIDKDKDNQESSQLKIEDIEISDMLESVKLNESSSTNGNAKVKKVQDPIQWFGVLVPSSLRNGQHKFQTAIELSGEVATVEARLKQIVEKYEHLKRNKRLLREKMKNNEEKS